MFIANKKYLKQCLRWIKNAIISLFHLLMTQFLQPAEMMKINFNFLSSLNPRIMTFDKNVRHSQKLLWQPKKSWRTKKNEPNFFCMFEVFFLLFCIQREESVPSKPSSNLSDFLCCFFLLWCVCADFFSLFQCE